MLTFPARQPMFRLFTNADIAAIRTIDRLCFPSAIDEMPDRLDPHPLSASVVDLFEFGCVGFVMFEPWRRKTLRVLRLAVHPEFQRMGYGSTLLDVLKESCERRGLTGTIQIDIDQTNLPAARFLKKNNFRGSVLGADEYRFVHML